MKKLTTKLITALSLMGILAIGADCAEVNLGACAGCHGKTWNKKALNKSKIVSDMNTTDIVTALTGYKDGSYGGSMASIMKGQITKYTKEELESAALKIKDK